MATATAKARACLSAALFAALVATAWTGFSRPAEGEATDAAGHDRQSLLARLEAGDTARLNADLVALQSLIGRGEVGEAELENAVAAFASADPGLEAKLTSWVDGHPDSFAARLARGLYYRHLGRLGLGDETQPANGYLALAHRDLEAAIERQPGLGVAYALLIDMAMAENKGLDADHWFELGIAADPRSVSLRRAYLLSLRPWQRPDQDPVQLMARLDTLVEDLQEAGEETPGLAALAGFHDYLTAELLRRQRRHGLASHYYREALDGGRDWVYLHGAGLNAISERTPHRRRRLPQRRLGPAPSGSAASGHPRSYALVPGQSRDGAGGLAPRPRPRPRQPSHPLPLCPGPAQPRPGRRGRRGDCRGPGFRAQQPEASQPAGTDAAERAGQAARRCPRAPSRPRTRSPCRRLLAGLRRGALSLERLRGRRERHRHLSEHL